MGSSSWFLALGSPLASGSSPSAVGLHVEGGLYLRLKLEVLCRVAAGHSRTTVLGAWLSRPGVEGLVCTGLQRAAARWCRLPRSQEFQDESTTGDREVILPCTPIFHVRGFLCARVSSSGSQRREKRSERTPENSAFRFISLYMHGLPNLLKYIANTCSANYAYAHLLSSYLHIPPCLSISLHCGQVFTSPRTYRAIVTQLASQLHYLLNGLEHVHVIISRSFIILLMIK